MKTTLKNFVLCFLLTGFLSGCSLFPTFPGSEPEMGAALASSSGKHYNSGNGTSLMVDGVLFDFEKAALKPGANEIVSRAVDYLRSNPDSQVMVEGHTDHIGSKKYNQKLSVQRAGAIVSALKANGISSDRITAVGYGETKPIADNNTDDGRSANRRVEIILQNEF